MTEPARPRTQQLPAWIAALGLLASGGSAEYTRRTSERIAALETQSQQSERVRTLEVEAAQIRAEIAALQTPGNPRTVMARETQQRFERVEQRVAELERELRDLRTGGR